MIASFVKSKRKSFIKRDSFIMILFQRVALAADELEGSRAKMARTMGAVLKIHPRTFEGYFCEEREKNLWPILPDILKQYPQISREWLYFGEGPMLKTQSFPLKFTAVNLSGYLVGDLLQNVLDFAKIHNSEIIKNTNIDKITLDALLSSRTKPTFEQLEQLYLKFDINPSYFFDGNENKMWAPSDPLLRVYYILGKLGRDPHKDDLIDIFDADKDEAIEFLKEWVQFRKNKKQRVLPQSWIDRLQEKLNVSYSCISKIEPPFVNIPSTTATAHSATPGAPAPSKFLDLVIQRLREVNASDETIEKAILAVACRNSVEPITHHQAAGNE